MKEHEVRELASWGFFNRRRIKGKIEETHISWVVLTRKYVYKIKKPLKLSFLDFSTLALRKEYCEKEVRLNSRFSDIYLQVAPIRFTGRDWIVGAGEGAIRDYCVVMKRMAVSKRMDNQLHSQKVTTEMMRRLALEIASFHARAEKIFTPFDLSDVCNAFNDIDSVREFIAENLGDGYYGIVVRAMTASDAFLRRHAGRFARRVELGFKRDVHGDLHSGNIFLYRKPVLFDCIEFNDQYRQIDVLYEIAFLCMDVEALGRMDLSRFFLKAYQEHFTCFQEAEDEHIFIYFKCLRANIRAKVHAISADGAKNKDEFNMHTGEVKKYLNMMEKYMQDLSGVKTG